METLRQDIRYTLRMLVRAPGFTLVAVFSLALGIGPNSLIFNLIDAVMLRPLPHIQNPDRLVRFEFKDQQDSYSVVSYPDYVDYRDRNNSFSDVIASSPIALSFNQADQSELVHGLIVSGNYFPALGVNPIIGRAFLPEEDQTPGSHPVAVISHNFWKSRFASNQRVVDQTILLNGQRFSIIGVAPEGFTGTDAGFVLDIWVPMMMQAQVRPPGAGVRKDAGNDLLNQRNTPWLDVFARLKPGVDAKKAQSEMTLLARQLQQTYSKVETQPQVLLYQGINSNPRIRSALMSGSALLIAVVGLVLLIACANVANLLLVKATARRKEIAVRLALGASRKRLVRQLLTEGVILSSLGGLVGLLLALWTARLLLAFKPPTPIPISFDLSLEWRVLSFTIVLSILTGIVFGLTPAFQATRPDVATALKEETSGVRPGGRRIGLKDLLVISQISLSLVLLIGAALFIRSFRNAQTMHPGFDPENVLLLSLNLDLHGYTEERGNQFLKQLVDKAETCPGVKSASIARIVPLSDSSMKRAVLIDGHQPSADGRPMFISINAVSRDYFDTLRIPVLDGRDFSDKDDAAGAKVVVINETMARRFWPGEQAIGRQVSFSGMGTAPSGDRMEVVGVVKDSKSRTLGERAEPHMYVPLAQNYDPKITLFVRTEGDPKMMTDVVRHEIQVLDKFLPIFDI